MPYTLMRASIMDYPVFYMGTGRMLLGFNSEKTRE